MRLTHEMDEDSCCIHCGYDGAEATWLRRVRPDEYNGYDDGDVYCEKRRNVEPTPGLKERVDAYFAHNFDNYDTSSFKHEMYEQAERAWEEVDDETLFNALINTQTEIGLLGARQQILTAALGRRAMKREVRDPRGRVVQVMILPNLSEFRAEAEQQINEALSNLHSPVSATKH